MAQIVTSDDTVVVELSPVEKVGALHGDVRVPRSAVRDVRVVEDGFSERRGLRSPGTAVPRTVALGTWRGRDGKDFVAIRRGKPAVVVELDGAGYDRLIVSVDDPARVREELARQ